MASSGQKRTRLERVAALELPPGHWERMLISLRRRDVLLRMVLGVVTAVLLCAVLRAWNPPFAYRSGYTPRRDIVARCAFQRPDPGKTEAARELARRQARYVYVNNPEPLSQLRASLRNTLLELAAAETSGGTIPELWAQFQPARAEKAPQPTVAEQQKAFTKFRDAITGEQNLAKIEAAVASALAPFEKHGLLDKLEQPLGQGNQEEIFIHPARQPAVRELVAISDVLIGDGTAIQKGLAENLKSGELAERIFAWLRPRLRPTLALDLDASRQSRQEAAEKVHEVSIDYDVGQTLAKGGQPLEGLQIDLLRREYAAANAARSLVKPALRTTVVLAVILCLFGLGAFYLYRRERRLLVDLKRLALILALALVTVTIARWASRDAWRAELVPLLVFGETVAIVYRQEVALVLSAILVLITVLNLGFRLEELMLLMGVCGTAILQLGRVRTRSKLIYVGFTTGLVAVALTIGINVLDNQPITWALLREGMRSGVFALSAGFLMQGLLPFIEPLFGVLTDISLLELGDVAHPLLQELVRRAPSTYNHSVTVGSIAEAAADAIGARGLLVRVGAYYHDIGKMLKPGYFIENQGTEANRHETLVPAMSTLVIIAHIKDGANLARQHHLPEPIIDFIQQHHGTTLVGYFFDRASQQSQNNPDGGTVEESAFRYPGPKPQTKEAGVLMLADAVESASRTLVDPTPARIENLVREVAEQRLDDGQFDESNLSLRELRTIQNSLTKSLTAIYHGRVKYPDQRTA